MPPAAGSVSHGRREAHRNRQGEPARDGEGQALLARVRRAARRPRVQAEGRRALQGIGPPRAHARGGRQVRVQGPRQRVRRQRPRRGEGRGRGSGEGGSQGGREGRPAQPPRGAGGERGHRPFRRQRPDRRRGGARRRHRRQRGDDPGGPAQPLPRGKGRRRQAAGGTGPQAHGPLGREIEEGPRQAGQGPQPAGAQKEARRHHAPRRHVRQVAARALDQPQAEAAREQGGAARRQGRTARRDRHLRHPRQDHAAAPHQGGRHEHRPRMARPGRRGRRRGRHRHRLPSRDVAAQRSHRRRRRFVFRRQRRGLPGPGAAIRRRRLHRVLAVHALPQPQHGLLVVRLLLPRRFGLLHDRAAGYVPVHHLHHGRTSAQGGLREGRVGREDGLPATRRHPHQHRAAHGDLCRRRQGLRRARRPRRRRRRLVGRRGIAGVLLERRLGHDPASDRRGGRHHPRTVRQRRVLRHLLHPARLLRQRP